MNKTNFVAALAVIAAANQDGFTVDARTLQPIAKGYAVAFADTQNSFGNAGLRRVVEFAHSTNKANAFGGWFDTETGLYYWDAVKVYATKAAAARAAKRNGQIAYFDLTNGVEIRLK